MSMYGNYAHTIDAKGRVFIPSKLREKLGKEFFVTISFEKCLTVYSMDRWRKAEEKLEGLSQTAQMELRPLFSNAAPVELDAQGRIALTQNLRNKVGIERDVTIVGTGLYVQIWDTETYKRVEEGEMDRENLKSVIDKYGF